jgi:hypothetical protein
MYYPYHRTCVQPPPVLLFSPLSIEFSHRSVDVDVHVRHIRIGGEIHPKMTTHSKYINQQWYDTDTNGASSSDLRSKRTAMFFSIN